MNIYVCIFYCFSSFNPQTKNKPRNMDSDTITNKVYVDVQTFPSSILVPLFNHLTLKCIYSFARTCKALREFVNTQLCTTLKHRHPRWEDYQIISELHPHLFKQFECLCCYESFFHSMSKDPYKRIYPHYRARNKKSRPFSEWTLREIDLRSNLMPYFSLCVSSTTTFIKQFNLYGTGVGNAFTFWVDHYLTKLKKRYFDISEFDPDTLFTDVLKLMEEFHHQFPLTQIFFLMSDYSPLIHMSKYSLPTGVSILQDLVHGKLHERDKISGKSYWQMFSDFDRRPYKEGRAVKRRKIE